MTPTGDAGRETACANDPSTNAGDDADSQRTLLAAQDADADQHTQSLDPKAKRSRSRSRSRSRPVTEKQCDGGVQKHCPQ